ncbi:hypothetical protein C8R48DRAFT_674550 [Suillus tomentosus]|nr:hypothetical protein C8R48DRAFT_674550 [Suillus tomentosus]
MSRGATVYDYGSQPRYIREPGLCFGVEYIDAACQVSQVPVPSCPVGTNLNNGQRIIIASPPPRCPPGTFMHDVSNPHVHARIIRPVDRYLGIKCYILSFPDGQQLGTVRENTVSTWIDNTHNGDYLSFILGASKAGRTYLPDGHARSGIQAMKATSDQPAEGPLKFKTSTRDSRMDVAPMFFPLRLNVPLPMQEQASMGIGKQLGSRKWLICTHDLPKWTTAFLLWVRPWPRECLALSKAHPDLGIFSSVSSEAY